MLVKDLMTSDPACCTPDTKLQDVAKLMVENDCGCIPVVENDDTKKPVGMITDRDITCRIVAEGKNPLDLTAREAMSDSVHTVPIGTRLEECLDVMEKNQIRRVAVVDNNGSCCGIIAQADIAERASKHQTAEVVQEISKSAGA